MATQFKTQDDIASFLKGGTAVEDPALKAVAQPVSWDTSRPTGMQGIPEPIAGVRPPKEEKPLPSYAKKGSYVTKLAPADEAKFQQWVKQNKVPWQDTPTADYDMRGYYKALNAKDPNAKQQKSQFDGKLHFPDTYKTPYHKTFSNESMYATPDAPHWDGNRLVGKDGQVVADETPKAMTPPPGVQSFKSQEDIQKFLGSQPKGVAKQQPKDRWQDVKAWLANKPGPGLVDRAWDVVKQQKDFATGETFGQEAQQAKTQVWDRINNPFGMSDEEIKAHRETRDKANKAIDEHLGKTAQLGRWGIEQAEESAEGFLSPLNIGLMFTGYGEAKLAGAVGKDAAMLLGKLASTYWTAQMAEGAGEEVTRSANAFWNGDYETGVKAALGAVINGVMARHSLNHQVAEERVARDLDTQAKTQFQKNFTNLNDQEKAHAIFEMTKDMPLYRDLDKPDRKGNTQTPNEKRQAIIEGGMRRMSEPPAAISDDFKSRINDAIESNADPLETRAQIDEVHSGMQEMREGFQGLRDQQAETQRKAREAEDRVIADKLAQKRESQESAQILDFPILTDVEREWKRQQFAQEEAFKTLERERGEHLQEEERRKDRERAYQAHTDDQASEEDYQRARMGYGFETVDRRAHADLHTELQRTIVDEAMGKNRPEAENYQRTASMLSQAAEEIYPGTTPIVVEERLRRKRRDGFPLTEHEQRFMDMSRVHQQAERSLAKNKGMTSQAMDMLHAQRVNNILGLSMREEDLTRAADTLRRQAILAETPEAAEHLAEQAAEAKKLAEQVKDERIEQQVRRAAEGEEPTTRGDRAPADSTPGNASRIDLPAGNPLPIHYAAMRLSDLILSHDPNSFQWNTEYEPRRLQPRDLSTNMQAQEAIITSSKPENYKLDRYTSDNPTALEGPAIVLPDGTVAGGNSRLARLKRVLETGSREAIVRELHESFTKFGIDPANLIDTGDPYIPVRILDNPPSDMEGLIRLGQDLNRDTIMGFSTEEQAVMSGERLTPEDVESFATMLDAMPDGATLRDMLRMRPEKVLDIMTARGIIPDNKRAEFVTADGQLTEKARDTFEAAIMGRVVDDPDLLATTPREVLSKIERALPSMVKIKGSAPEWNVSDYLKQAMKVWRTVDSVRNELNDIGRQSDSLIDKYYQPGNFKMGTAMLTFGEGELRPRPHPITEALAKLLEKKPLHVKQALDGYADDAEGRQDYLMGQPAPIDAFNRHIGEKVGITVHSSEWGTLEAVPEEQQKRIEEAMGPQKLPKAEQPTPTGEMKAPPKAAPAKKMASFPEPGAVQPYGVEAKAAFNFKKFGGKDFLSIPEADAVAHRVREGIGEAKQRYIDAREKLFADFTKANETAAKDALFGYQVRLGDATMAERHAEWLRSLPEGATAPPPDIPQGGRTITVPEARLTEAGATGTRGWQQTNKVARAFDIEGRPFIVMDTKPGEASMVALFTPAEWGNRITDLQTTPERGYQGRKVKLKGKTYIVGGRESEITIKAGPTPQEASTELRSAVENGSVTTEGLRKLFEASPGTRDAAAELMEVFGRIIPNATGMELPDFLREKLADVRTGKEGEITTKGLGQSVKGATHFLNDGRAIISLFEKADPTTALHEFFHVIRKYVREGDLQVLEKFADVKDGIWDEDAEEKTARAFERYHRDGKAPLPELQAVFQRLSEIFRKIYRTLKGSPLAGKVSKELSQTFDKWYGAEPAPMTPPPGFNELETPAPPRESLEDLTPDERERSVMIANGGADITGWKGTTRSDEGWRLRRFDHPDEAEAFAVNNHQKMKGVQIWQTTNGKAFAVFVPKSPDLLFQRDPDSLAGVIKHVDNLKRQRAAESDFGKLVSLNREIERLETKHGLGGVLSLAPRPDAKAVEAELQRPVEHRQVATAPKRLFPDPEEDHGRTANTLRASSDGPLRVPEPESAAGVAGRGDKRELVAGDQPSLQGLRGAGAGGPTAGRLASTRNSLSATVPNRVAPAIRMRGVPVVDAGEWRERLTKLGMPAELPAPTVKLRPEIAVLLRFPGQREVVESTLSALQQYDASIVATPPGTGKTYTELAIAKEHFQPGDRQLIVTRNKDIINQRKGFKEVGKKIFDHEVKDIPDDLSNVDEGTYAITYSQLTQNLKELRKVPWSITIADEAGEARRWWESQQGAALKELSNVSGKVVYASATPFHTALEIGYMDKLGLWQDVGFDTWARQFGVRKNPSGGYSGGNAPQKLLKLRQQLVERGQFVHQDVNYEGYRAEFAHVPLTEEHKQKIQDIKTAFAEAERYFMLRGKGEKAAGVRGNGVNFMKSYLERVRLPQAIELAKKARAAGWQPVFFTEHRAERAELYDFMKDADRAMGGRLSELIPKLPDVFETLKAEFGDDIGNFSGRYRAERQKDKDAFLDGDKNYLFVTYGAGGVGTSLHDDIGQRPRFPIYLGPPWSGVMLDQALGRAWRFGTKSNVHAVFMVSNAKPETNMILTKIAPRLESLRAAIGGINGDDPLINSMRQLERSRAELGAYVLGNEQKVNMSDFDFVDDNVPISSWKDVNVISAEHAKNKGMRYNGEVDEPGVRRLFQEGGDLNVPQRFRTPEEAEVDGFVDEVVQNMAEGDPVPGAPQGIPLGGAERTMASGNTGAEVMAETARQGDADKNATAKISAQTAVERIIAANRAGEISAGTVDSPEWRAHYPLGEKEAKKTKSQETYRASLAISGRQSIESWAQRAGQGEIGRQIHMQILDYNATKSSHAGELIHREMQLQKTHKLSKQDFRVMWQVKEGRLPAPNERIANAVRDYAKLLNDVRQFLEDNEIENKRYVDGKPAFVTFSDIPENERYMPHQYNYREKIKFKDPKTGEDITTTLGDLIGGTLSQARRERILSAMQADSGWSAADIEDWLNSRRSRTPVAGNVERSRRAGLPYYRMDRGALWNYFEQVGEVIARKQIFGQEREKLDGRLARVKDDRARQNINNIMDTLLSPAPWLNTGLQKFYRKFTTAQIIAKMTFSPVKVPFHLAHTALVQGTPRFILGGILHGALNPREMRERAIWSGALTEQVIARMTLDEGVTDKGMANKMLHYTGFHSLYNMDRIIANSAAEQWMQKYALPKLLKKAKTSDYVRRQLKDTYLLSDKAIDEAIKNRKWTQEDLRRAGVSLTNKALFTNDPTELPRFMRRNSSDELNQNIDVGIRMAMVLKSFMVRTAALLKEQLVDEARKGNMRPWAVFITAYPFVGEAMQLASAGVRGSVQAVVGGGTSQKNPVQSYEDKLAELFEDPSVGKFVDRYLDDIGRATALEMFQRVVHAYVFPSDDPLKRKYERQDALPDFLKNLAGADFEDMYNVAKTGGDVVEDVQDDRSDKAADEVLKFLREEIPATRTFLPKSVSDIDGMQMQPPP